MRSGQGESGSVVVESRRSPPGSGMTYQAVLRELIGHMIGVGYRSIIIFVAGPAIGRGPGVHSVDMT